MIQYTLTISEDLLDNSRKNISYGLKATNEKGEDVLEIPSISNNQKTVEYLVERFNQVRVNRDTFYS
jgi:hypothetical protein